MHSIAEALYILALDHQTGTIVAPAAHILEPVLAGAILAELVLQGRLDEEALTAQHRVLALDLTATEHPLLDKILFEIFDTIGERKLKYWINTLIYKNIQQEIAQHLVEKGVLIRKKKRLRLVSPPGENFSAKIPLKNRLRTRILVGQPDLDPSDKILLALLDHSGLLKLVFTLDERKAAHKEIKKLVESGGSLACSLDVIIAAACSQTALTQKHQASR